MFRRIELINHYPDREQWYDDGEYIPRDFIHGIMGVSHHEVADAWAPMDESKPSLRGPDRNVPSNCRFYFTEKGWDAIGRKVVAACIKNKQEYRVIAVKETDAQIAWRDKATDYEVALQPKRKKP